MTFPSHPNIWKAGSYLPAPLQLSGCNCSALNDHVMLNFSASASIRLLALSVCFCAEDVLTLDSLLTSVPDQQARDNSCHNSWAVLSEADGAACTCPRPSSTLSSQAGELGLGSRFNPADQQVMRWLPALASLS